MNAAMLLIEERVRFAQALGFIRLRRGDTEQARGILQALGRLDPEDLVGSSVIGSLLDAVEG